LRRRIGIARIRFNITLVSRSQREASAAKQLSDTAVCLHEFILMDRFVGKKCLVKRKKNKYRKKAVPDQLENEFQIQRSLRVTVRNVVEELFELIQVHPLFGGVLDPFEPPVIKHQE